MRSSFVNQMQRTGATGLIALVLLACVLPLAKSQSPDEHLLDQKGIQDLEFKALHAAPQEQCFLLAQLVHQMTEMSAQLYADGETTKALEQLRRIHQFTVKMGMALADRDKRLKNAEILLRHTAFRLREYLHNANEEDQSAVKQTLSEIDKLEVNTLAQVFRR